MASTASAAFIKRTGSTSSTAPPAPAYVAVESVEFCSGSTKKSDKWVGAPNEGQTGDPDCWSNTWPPFLVYTGSDVLADPVLYGDVEDLTRKHTNAIVFVR